MQLLNDYCESLTLTSNQPVYYNESPSLSTEVVAIPAQRWDINYSSIDVGPDVDEQRAFFEALESLNDGSPFTWQLPIHSTTRGEAGGSPEVDGALSAGVSSVTISGATLSQTDWSKLGDIFRFNNHTKVYKVTASADSDLGGGVTLNFRPALRVAVPDGTALTMKNVEMTVRKSPDADMAAYERVAGDFDLQAVEMSFVEVL